MKPRIKTDGWILAIITILTAVFYVLPQIQEKNVVRDNFFDILGILFLLKGIYLRMAARGHKQCHSSKGSGLVTTGVYRYVRNPMYLGTFYIGCGFVLIAWTWWGFPVFCLLFYLRFRGIICSEEKYLLNVFGKKYE